MSRVYWHTPEGTAELLGSERHYARSLCSDIALGIIGVYGLAEHHDRLARVIRGGENIFRASVPDIGSLLYRARDLSTWFHVGEMTDPDTGFIFGDHVIPPGELALNTAINLGLMPLRLLAWMTGLCETHGYWEPDALPLLRQTISDGRWANILRAEVGWESVLELLNTSAGPVVWSYSVCQTFPSPYEMGILSAEDEEDIFVRHHARAWDARTERERFDLGMEWLRGRAWPPALDLEVEQGFLTGETAFDVSALLWQERLDEIATERRTGATP